MPVKPAHPQPRHQQAEVPAVSVTTYSMVLVMCGRDRSSSHQSEKQHASGYQRRVDFGPGDFFTLDSMCSQAGYCQ